MSAEEKDPFANISDEDRATMDQFHRLHANANCVPRWWRCCCSAPLCWYVFSTLNRGLSGRRWRHSAGLSGCL